MARYLSVPRITFAIVVLLVPNAILEMLRPAAIGQDDSVKTKAALQDRDRLRDQGEKPGAAEKRAEATSAANAALAIERKASPEGDDLLAASLGQLAELFLQREDFATDAEDPAETSQR
jgi:hypothetical protein